MLHDDSEPRPSLAHIVAGAAPELLGAGVGGAVQRAGADPASSTLAASAVLVALRLDRVNRQHAIGRAARTITLTADRMGGEELLEQRAGADEHRRELTARVLRAAARTPLEDKLQALAKVFASGLDPDGRVDEALVLVAALDDLEAPHVQVLRLLTNDSPDEDPAHRGLGWLIEQTVNALPGYALVMPAILSTLSRHGLGRELGMYGGQPPRHHGSRSALPRPMQFGLDPRLTRRRSHGPWRRGCGGWQLLDAPRQMRELAA